MLSSPDSGPITTSAPSCSTSVRTSWMIRSGVSSPHPIPTSSMSRPATLAPGKPSREAVAEAGAADPASARPVITTPDSHELDVEAGDVGAGEAIEGSGRRVRGRTAVFDHRQRRSRHDVLVEAAEGTLAFGEDAELEAAARRAARGVWAG